jgi:hypothetical protein
MARRPNAYSQLIQESGGTSQQEDTPPAESSNTVKLQRGNTVKSSKTVKFTFYPEQQHIDKLYDMMEAYRRKTGVKINQQDLMRRILDVIDINTVLP